jgi:hypothetical protein
MRRHAVFECVHVSVPVSLSAQHGVWTLDTPMCKCERASHTSYANVFR